MAGAPRSYLVPPKIPLFRRTGTKFVLVLVAEALVFLVLVVAGAQTEADRRRDQISEFTTLVQAQLYQSGAAQQSFTGPLILPEMGQAVAQMDAGQVEDPDQIAESAEGWTDVATGASDAIRQIEAEGLELKEARNLMGQGLAMFAELAAQVRVTVRLEGPDQRELIESINDQMNLSAQIFDAGWGKLQEARRVAGLETQAVLPGDLGGIPGLPGGGVPAPPGA